MKALLLKKFRRDFLLFFSKTKESIFWIAFIQFCILSVTITIGYYSHNLPIHFGQNGIIAWVSFSFLFLLSIFCVYIASRFYQAKKKFSSVFFWIFLGIGFLFLSFDEVFMLHNLLGQNIRDFLHIITNKQTSRLDDIIVFSYFLIVSLWVFFFRNSFYTFKETRSFLFLSTISFLIMIFFDSLGKSKENTTFFILYTILEESFKIITEGLLLLVLIYCLQKIKKIK
ncbi:MAG: hypothetical protein IPN70_03200 [Candidatus Moraniibacteriota bacterium]|nr:MAG: hypothetical protein IPN70_03200 [Candidatus Moranbacteria bacterium]